MFSCVLQRSLQTSCIVNVYDYFLDDSLLDDDGTLRLCLRMFHDLNLTKKFSIPDEVTLPFHSCI